jgi:hypothetical protein
VKRRTDTDNLELLALAWQAANRKAWASWVGLCKLFGPAEFPA